MIQVRHKRQRLLFWGIFSLLLIIVLPFMRNLEKIKAKKTSERVFEFILPEENSAEITKSYQRASLWLKAPLARLARYPLGAKNGSFSYNAQGLFTRNEFRGGLHSGEDWNGIGGDDTDFGDPVYAIADGLVLWAGDWGEAWGKVVVLGHRFPGIEGEQILLTSIYAHLSEIEKKAMQVVKMGDVIGKIGSADGAYKAHLHFELRRGFTVAKISAYSQKQNFDLLRLEDLPRIAGVKLASRKDSFADFICFFELAN